MRWAAGVSYYAFYRHQKLVRFVGAACGRPYTKNHNRKLPAAKKPPVLGKFWE